MAGAPPTAGRKRESSSCDKKGLPDYKIRRKSNGQAMQVRVHLENGPTKKSKTLSMRGGEKAFGQ